MIRNPVSIRLAVDADNEAIRGLKVKPFQQLFAGRPADFIKKYDEGISLHVIEQNEQIVGLFRLDRQFQYSHTFAAFDTPGIGDFIVDDEFQGKGVATETCRLMPSYLRNIVPRARGAYFLVNTKNAGAYKAFIRGGCIDTGEKHTRGHTGPQYILWMGF